MGFDSPTGKGAIGMVERKRIVLGNAKFLGELTIRPMRWQTARRRCALMARRPYSWPSTARLPVSSRIADPVKADTPAALDA